MLLGHVGVNIVRIAAVLLAISFFLPWGTIKAEAVLVGEVGSLSFNGLKAAQGKLDVEFTPLGIDAIDVTINVPGKTKYYLVLLVALITFSLAFATDALKLNRIIPAVIFGILGLATLIMLVLNWGDLDDEFAIVNDTVLSSLVRLTLETGIGIYGVMAASIGIMIGSGVMILEALIRMTQKDQPPAEEPIADQPGDLQF